MAALWYKQSLNQNKNKKVRVNNLNCFIVL